MATVAQSIELLSAIVPAFSAKANSIIGDSNLATRARDGLGSREPYYAGLRLEFHNLEATLSLWNPATVISEVELRKVARVLDGLESRTGENVCGSPPGNTATEICHADTYGKINPTYRLSVRRAKGS
jgi:hypothetical protein